MECFYCSKEINSEHRKRLVPLEVPYGNLWFHRECYDIIKPEEELYLAQNSERCYTYLYKDVKRSKNK